MKVKRGEVYLADLSDASGSEQGKVRPVVIIQNNRGNKYSPTTIVAARRAAVTFLRTLFIMSPPFSIYLMIQLYT